MKHRSSFNVCRVHKLCVAGARRARWRAARERLRASAPQTATRRSSITTGSPRAAGWAAAASTSAGGQSSGYSPVCACWNQTLSPGRSDGGAALRPLEDVRANESSDATCCLAKLGDPRDSQDVCSLRGCGGSFSIESGESEVRHNLLLVSALRSQGLSSRSEGPSSLSSEGEMLSPNALMSESDARVEF